MVWLDIENHDLFYSSCTDNQNFVNNWLAQASSMLGANRVGIYSNWVQWNDIMCGWTGAKSHQLWYPHYDNLAAFSDFQAFGGWTKPNIKQYVGDTTACSVAIDKDFY